MNKSDFIIILLKNNWSTGLCFFNEKKKYFFNYSLKALILFYSFKKYNKKFFKKEFSIF